MCGLAGYHSRTRYPDDVLVAMTSQLTHRGPDAEGYYRNGSVAFGHRRLSVLDIAGSIQPMSTPDGSLTCVFNGEIYNFSALRDTLSKRGHAFQTRGDTEVLLYAYREYGTAMLDHLQGMFAFALWDSREQRLFLARDHLGVKPLYYHWSGTEFVFGSELKSVIAHPAVPRELNLNALGLYLERQFIPAPISVYRDVQKLGAGHAMTIGKGRLDTWQYWRPDYSNKFQFDESQARASLKKELRDSVERMLVADVPLGSFLSGGIDSSLISAMMAEITGKPIETFNLGFEGEGAESEHAQARLVSRHIGSNHHLLMLQQSDLLSAFHQWVDAFDEPFADPAALPTMLLAQLARRQVTVVLTGEGADEVFSGYDNYRKRVSEERVSGVLGARYSPLRYLVRLLPLRVRKDRLLKAIVEPLSRRYVTIPSVFDSTLFPGLFSDPFLAAQRTHMADCAARFFDECNSSHYIDKLMYVDARLWLPDDLLTKVDRATMAYSLEARVPYLDHRFFEFCARLDPNLKQRGRTGKYLLRKVAEEYLPASIIERPKQGFMPPLAEWLSGVLKQETLAALSTQGLGKRGLFRPGALDKLLGQHYGGHRNHRGRLWALLMLEKWFQRYAPDYSL